MEENNKCPIWGEAIEEKKQKEDRTYVNSPRAGGKYSIYHNALLCFNDIDDATKARLTTWLVEQRRLGVECPKITKETVENIKKSRALSVYERADNLLRYLESQSHLLGHVVKFYAQDNSKARDTAYQLLAWTESRSITEVITLAEYCHEQNWIEHRKQERTGASKNTLHEVMLKPAGYARLAELQGTNPNSVQAFVAMWFDDSMEDAFVKAIGPAIHDAGYAPLRIDKKDHNNKIDDEIIAEIRRSRFVVADFTHGEKGMRGGVYYEAGFAHGLNVPVIFTCREDVIGKIHFDTRQYNHITWKPEKLDEFRKALSNRISATIGDGPLKKKDK